MADDSTNRNGPTRRGALKYGDAVAGGGLLAGCTGTSPDGPNDGEGSYTVSMAPMGEVSFESVPET